MAAVCIPDQIKNETNLALLAAQEFAKLYHDTFDKRRQNIGKMYQEQAQIVWNGNPFNGREKIVEFFNTLPSSQHTVEGMDTQPVMGGLVGTEGDTSTIIITFFGKAKYKSEKEGKSFTQTVLLASQDSKWKVVSDNYRFLD